MTASSLSASFIKINYLLDLPLRLLLKELLNLLITDKGVSFSNTLSHCVLNLFLNSVKCFKISFRILYSLFSISV